MKDWAQIVVVAGFVVVAVAVLVDALAQPERWRRFMSEEWAAAFLRRLYVIVGLLLALGLLTRSGEDYFIAVGVLTFIVGFVPSRVLISARARSRRL